MNYNWVTKLVFDELVDLGYAPKGTKKPNLIAFSPHEFVFLTELHSASSVEFPLSEEDLFHLRRLYIEIDETLSLPRKAHIYFYTNKGIFLNINTAVFLVNGFPLNKNNIQGGPYESRINSIHADVKALGISGLKKLNSFDDAFLKFLESLDRNFSIVGIGDKINIGNRIKDVRRNLRSYNNLELSEQQMKDVLAVLDAEGRRVGNAIS